MEVKYKYTESTIKPSIIDINGNTVYLRTDIVETTRASEQGGQTTYWTYQEAKLTRSEFNDYADAILVSGQKSGNDSQLIIMEAIADLYDVIAGTMSQEAGK